jgi:hypothetical protein
MNPKPRSWSSEDGIALVLAMFMVLLISLVGASLVTTGRTETLSSLNYKGLSQARYAAESGLNAATHYLLYQYTPPGTDAGDPLNNYDMTVSPVTYQNAAVVLTSDGTTAHYPITDKQTNFKTYSHYENLMMNTSKATYSARARLLSMKVFTDAFTNQPVTVQTWEVTGVGSLNGAGASNVEVSAIIERQSVSAFRYAAFAAYKGCSALNFGGGGSTDSYSSTAPLGGGGYPTTTASGGNVGTNGNLDESGVTTVINGTLSTPRAGVGNCTANNVTALSYAGAADLDQKVTGGLVELPQTVKQPDPAQISPAPPTTSLTIGKTDGCTDVSACTPLQAGSPLKTYGLTIAPAAGVVQSMGNVTLTGGVELHLAAGTYEWNSISVSGGAKIVIDSGPVIMKFAGTDQTTPIDLTGSTVANTTFKPDNFQILYAPPPADIAAIAAGTLTKAVKVTGGTQASMLVYAPRAEGTILGGSDLYGAVVFNKVKDMGGTHIHYDRNLQRSMFTSGNPTMTSFNWSSAQ